MTKSKKKKTKIKFRPAVVSAADVKLIALQGISIAAAEKQLDVPSLNKLFEKRKDLKDAWTRGRFLRALAELGETKLPIAEVEIELKKTGHLKPDDDLQKIFITDTESRDCFNQARHKHRCDVLNLIKNNLHKASPAALRIYQTLFNTEMAAPAADLSHITSKQMQELTGKSRETVEADWPKERGLHRNSDGTFNLFVFMEWFERHIINTNIKSVKPEKDSLTDIKRDKLKLEMAKEAGSLLPREEVISGYISRYQLLKALHQKRIDNLPEIIGNQTPATVKEILKKSFDEIFREFITTPPDLKLNPEQFELMSKLLESIKSNAAD